MSKKKKHKILWDFENKQIIQSYPEDSTDYQLTRRELIVWWILPS